MVAVDRAGLLSVGSAPAPDAARYDGRAARVTRVIDGDTIEVALADIKGGHRTTRVRLWGIDAPEPGRDDRPAEPVAEEATELVESLTLGREVTLEIEPHRARGGYGRLLAHVRLEDGSLLAARLLEKGLARADARWPHSELQRFIELEKEAKDRGVGMWADDDQ